MVVFVRNASWSSAIIVVDNSGCILLVQYRRCLRVQAIVVVGRLFTIIK